ncbi:MAG: prephenate dehydrogenase, partial [Nocardia sp.]|nr:prephenate dehydrogenase [Nocardia sp.]
LLTAARDSLRDNGTLGELIDAGYSARGRYESAERWAITDISPGAHGWLERLRDAGRRGGVIRALGD